MTVFFSIDLQSIAKKAVLGQIPLRAQHDTRADDPERVAVRVSGCRYFQIALAAMERAGYGHIGGNQACGTFPINEQEQR